MIVFLSDSDGDDVAIDAQQIIAVTVGEMRRPALVPADGADNDDDSAPASPLRVTLVHTAAGPLVVAQSLRQVVNGWQTALRAGAALARDAARREVADVAR